MPRLLNDSREFLHSFGAPGVLPWREEHIIPRYSAAGIQQLAFVMPEGAPGTIEAGAAPSIETGATFSTALFSTRERAEQWSGENA